MSCIYNETTDRSDDDYTTTSDDEDDQSTSSADSSEEIDVGGVDDTWLHGSAHSSKKSGKSKKVHQNDLERKRREEISQSYRTLRETLGVKKSSRSQLLLASKRRIIEKQQKILDLRRRLEQLQRLVKELPNQGMETCLESESVSPGKSARR